MTDIFKVWTVHRGNDDRRNGPITDVCSTREFAITKAFKSGWYGGNAPIEEHWATKIHGDVYLLQSAGPVDLDGQLKEEQEYRKKAALAKLTDTDKIALGLSITE